MILYLYSGAGNTFVVIDGRGPELRTSVGDPADSQSGEAVDIVGLCAKYGTDGLMILREGTFYCGTAATESASVDPAYDFSMEFFNPDGSGGMMCGNGGRCIVAFADYLGIRPADGKIYRFVAGDGEHTGEILRVDGVVKTVRIKMIDVREFHPALDGWFIDTGTRHFVKFVPEVEGLDMDTEGRRYRWDPAFAPVGANANFVKIEPDRLKIRTFEKGVEGETLACGTGITASAIATWLAGTHTLSDTYAPAGVSAPAGISVPLRETISYNVRAREDDLRVEFRPVWRAGSDAPSSPRGIDHFEDVYLTGPAKLYRIIE